MIKKLYVYFFILLTSFSIAAAQPGRIPPSSEILLDLKKLTVLGSVLYIAAHPDDENTALLAYFSKGECYRTAYLSLTRGSGGQNLIGPEKDNLVGVIRTQELLEARKIDGAEQYFTRALDFGYSKSPEETFTFWNREDILSDVVWVIRKFQPDVIITRFNPAGGGGHGHHTASAVLALEAFKAAADPGRFKEQLEYVQPWQAKRIFWNSWMPRWQPEQADTSGLLKVDVGSYQPLLGKSFTEIAAISRSMHKSQGFGVSSRRGTDFEYLEVLDGAPAHKNPFEGIDTGWSRVAGAEDAGLLLKLAYESFDANRPADTIPLLIKAHKELELLPADNWVQLKMAGIEKAIQLCAGLWISATTDDYAAAPGDTVRLSIDFVNRSSYPLSLKKIHFPFADSDSSVEQALTENQRYLYEKQVRIPQNTPFSQPYWLVDEPVHQEFVIKDQTKRGLSEIIDHQAVCDIAAAGEILSFRVPVFYHWTDPVEGEQYRCFEIRPAVAVNLDKNVYIFPDENPKDVKVVLKSAASNITGDARLRVPPGWKVSPDSHHFEIKDKYDELALAFQIAPMGEPGEFTVSAEAVVDGKRMDKSLTEIQHRNIIEQTILSPAVSKLVRLDVRKNGQNIGYVMGSGDDIPETLNQLGYRLTMLSDEMLAVQNLTEYDAIVCGIRAFNTRDKLVILKDKLLDYVHNGGTLVVQYNVTNNLKVRDFGPYPFQIGHDRVADETAAVTLLNPDQVLLTSPNKITAADFENWVQERGLYFANQWDKRYTTVLSSHDPGESDKQGGLLYARYGDGVFIYTGYSFFRQLPAGVPGAIRLFVNLISAQGDNHNAD
jgi:LmbE family N-acetylglucosaminyl deacetylase